MLYNKLLLALAYVEFNTYKNRFLILIVIDVERFKKIKSRNQLRNCRTQHFANFSFNID